jgi:hypothetical protein
MITREYFALINGNIQMGSVFFQQAASGTARWPAANNGYIYHSVSVTPKWGP